MDRCQACTLCGVVKSSKLMIPQREVAVAPLHIGTCAFAHLRELSRFSLQGALRHRAQGPQRSTELTQRGAEALGECTTWCIFGYSHEASLVPGVIAARRDEGIPDVEVQRRLIHLDREAIEMTADAAREVLGAHPLHALRDGVQVDLRRVENGRQAEPVGDPTHITPMSMRCRKGVIGRMIFMR